MFNIETDLPIPVPDRRNGGRPARYPFAKLEPGQSFFVPGATIKPMARAANYHAKKLGRMFTCRTVSEPESGVRVWRLE